MIDDFVIEEATLGINDSDLSQSFTIYPNPSYNVFNLSWDRSFSKIDVEIFDITGKVILSKSSISIENNSYELDMSNYASGLYFARIKVENTQIVKKLILR